MFNQQHIQSCRVISRGFFPSPRLHFSTFSSNNMLTRSSCIQYLQNCKTMSQLKQIHSQIFVAGLQHSRGPLNKLMSFCADPSLGNMHYAEKIFSYMQDPSLFIYNIMIKAFAKRGSFKKAILLFAGLRVGGLWHVLKAIACLGETKEGKKVHGFVVKTGLDLETSVCNSLIDMYAQLGKVVFFELLFEEMPERDAVSWNVMISGYVRCRRFEDAVNVFWRMGEESNEKPHYHCKHSVCLYSSEEFGAR